MSLPSTMPTPAVAGKSCPVYRLDSPRTRALTGLDQLRRLAKNRPADKDVAVLLLNLAMGALNAVEAGNISDDADVEARRLYDRIVKACTKAFGRRGGLGKLVAHEDARPNCPVVNLAAYRAARSVS